jgi:hypothetical protein
VRAVQPHFTFAILALAALLLGSCAAELEKTRLHFKPDGSGEIAFELTAPRHAVPAKGVPDSLIEDVQKCGFVGRPSRRGNRFIVDATEKFENATMMATNVDCLPVDWTRSDMVITRSSNLWRTRYTTTVWFEQPVFSNSSNLSRYFSASDEDDGASTDLYGHTLLLFPLDLTIMVPEKVVRIENKSDLLGLASHMAMRDDVAEITLESPQDNARFWKQFDRLSDALERGENPKIPTLRYKFVVISEKNEIQLQTIIALIGALFGTGILVPLVRWLLARRRRAT